MGWDAQTHISSRASCGARVRCELPALSLSSVGIQEPGSSVHASHGRGIRSLSRRAPALPRDHPREGTHLQLERWEATEAFLLTGFLRFPRRLLHQMLYAGVRAWSSEFGIAASPMSVVNRFLASMLLTSDRARDLDLHAGWLPSPLYKVSPDWVVADWLFMDHLLNLFIIGASSQDEMKETKAHRLEADLENWVLKKTSGFGVSRLLRRNQHLRLNAKEYGELDISMIRGSVGYIVDCKAYRVSIGCLRGDARDTNNRYSYMEKELKKVIVTSRTLAEHPRGDNYRLPDGVERLIPLVCSPYVEPLYDFDEKHLVSTNVPRVCTPLELVDLLTAPVTDEILENPYTFRVARWGQ